MHAILRKASHDMEQHQLNNIVSAAMKLLNLISEVAQIEGDDLPEILVEIKVADL